MGGRGAVKITDSPHQPGTPEHDLWVRTAFIPGVGRERWESDRAKYGAASIGAKITHVLDDQEVPASGYARSDATKQDRASFVYKAFTDKIINLTLTFKDLNAAMMQAFGFSDEEIKISEDRHRRAEQAAMWLDVPEWAWRVMSLNERQTFGKVRVWTPQDGGSYVYYDHGVGLPEYGPPLPRSRPNREQRRTRPLRPSRLCPRHGGPADRCGPCQRASHGR